ncbi:MAG: tetratricopeptide repeat protein [Rhizomicrobium sp.]
MKTNFLRTAFLAVLMSTAAAVTANAQMSYSGGSGSKQSESSSSSSHATSPGKVGKAVGEQLLAAQKAMAANDWAGALADVKQAQAVPDQNAYETYEINKFLAIIAIQTKDYATAATASEAAADSPAMPDEEKKDMYHNALLLAVQAQQYDKAVVYGQQLAQINALDDSLSAALAQAYYYLKDMANAQKYAQQSIDMAKAAGKPANQTAMEIVMSAQAQNNNQAGAEATLEQLALQYNDPHNWGTLINVALGTKGIKDQDALYLFRLRQTTGAMSDPSDYSLMGTLAEQLGYPQEAVKVLEAGIAAGKVTSGQVGTTLTKARHDAAQDQRALAQIAAAAAKSKSGEQDVKLAEDYWGYGRFADAEAAARAAISKGGLKDPSEGQMILGLALTAQGKYAEAQTTFGSVSGSAARMKAAHLWSLYAQAKAKGTTAPASH